MENLLTPLDLVVFFGSLVAVMAVGLWAGWKEDTSADYYLAGKSTRWWGVAGSIFGSNVSANHIVGMMGVGFSVGLAPSHFEIGAIAGLLLLCYAFLPMYRKLNLFTLSQYLGRRYDDRSRCCYAVIMLAIMVIIGMVAGFYIGSRSLNLLLQNGRTATAKATVDPSGSVAAVELVSRGAGYHSPPTVTIQPPPTGKAGGRAKAVAAITDGGVAVVTITAAGSGYRPDKPPAVKITGGAAFDPKLSPGDVDPKWYRLGILLMVVVTGAYTIAGGLKAVIVTDVIQSILLLSAGLVVAAFTFAQPEIGGWAGMTALDAAASGAGKLHLYEPINHPKLPWTGVLTGLMVLHFYYWGTNQFIVQRALSARSDRDARRGIIAAGFLKLLIPFFSIGTGVAAFYLFRQRTMHVDQDAVFITLLNELVRPVGFGLVGLVGAGVIGAILSSIDSMMNSSATIVTFDIYRKYINPQASEKRLIRVGRLCIIALLAGSAFLTIFVMDPNSKDSFFLTVVTHQGRLIAGVVVAFALGMLWRRSTPTAGFVTIVAGVVLSYGLPVVYARFLGTRQSIAAVFGERLNAWHTIAAAAALCAVLHVVVSLLTQPDEEKSKLTWIGQGIFTTSAVTKFAAACGLTAIVYALLATGMVYGAISPTVAASTAALWTWAAFAVAAAGRVRTEGKAAQGLLPVVAEDRFWAGLLAAAAVFLMFYFY